MNEKRRYFLQPGYIFLSLEPYLVHTVLGSCVTVCIWDDVLKFGGMNHFIYNKPSSVFRDDIKDNYAKKTYYGIYAIPYLIKLMLDNGSRKDDLKTHLVGGAQNPVLSSVSVGRLNIEIAEKILNKHKIPVITRDVGSKMGRKVIFETSTGEILVYKVHKVRKADWYGVN